MKSTKILPVITAMIAAAYTLPACAQTIIGYVNSQISPGDNLLANEFSASPDNTLNSVLQNGVLTGSTFTELDPTSHQLLPLSVFNGSSWSINYDFPPDETGGVLHSPGSTTITLLGQVMYFNLYTAQSSFVPPTRAAGTYLLGYAVPFPNTAFQDIIGRDPLQGEWVKTLDAGTQTYNLTTFENGAWDNGTPSIPVDQSAYFGLVTVPEPSTYFLMGTGAALLFIASRRPQRHL